MAAASTGITTHAYTTFGEFYKGVRESLKSNQGRMENYWVTWIPSEAIASQKPKLATTVRPDSLSKFDQKTPKKQFEEFLNSVAKAKIASEMMASYQRCSGSFDTLDAHILVYSFATRSLVEFTCVDKEGDRVVAIVTAQLEEFKKPTPAPQSAGASGVGAAAAASSNASSTHHVIDLTKEIEF